MTVTAMDSRRRRSEAAAAVLAASLALHGGLLAALVWLARRQPEKPPVTIEIEVRDVPRPRAPAVEAPKAPSPAKPDPRSPVRLAVAPRPVRAARPAAVPKAPQPPPPPPVFGVPLDSTIDDPSAVAVPVGDTLAADPATAGGPHAPAHAATGVPGGVAGGAGTAPQATAAVVVQLPRVTQPAPQLDCPAFARGELAPPQEVRLSVDVGADGRVTAVRVTRGIGHGCDDVARRALQQARFTPALASDGKPAATTISWRYDFTGDAEESP